jgi:hypothetical protein
MAHRAQCIIVPGAFPVFAALAALRDALLPKLISGEVRVEDAGRYVGATV